MAELVFPSIKYKKSVLGAVREPGAQELFNRFKDLCDEATFDACVEQIKDYSNGVNLKAGFVPETTYWFVEGGEYIGRISIRHELNENLLRTGGHVGYDIRPSKRGMGYGKEILRLGLKKAKELGLKKVLATCNVWNAASKKIIEANGGVFENEVSGGTGKPNVLRYWIDIK
jgi:predicted acetyltransferase